MKYTLLSAGLIISILAFSLFSNNPKAYNGSEQYFYSWQSQNIGYSDIQRLYALDTAKLIEPFYHRTSLQKLQVNINCMIIKTIVRRDDKGVFACFQIKNPFIVFQNDVVPFNTKTLEEELTHPVLVQMTKQGSIQLVRIDTAISTVAAGLLKEILSRLQFVLPIKRQKSWLTREDNSSGTYVARYKLVNQNDSILQYQKTNEGYTSIKAAVKGQKIIADSRINISTDTTGIVVGLKVSETQTVLVNKDTVTTSVSNIMVALKAISKAPKNELATIFKLERSSSYNDWERLNAPLSEDKINRMTYANTLENDNFHSLMMALKMANPQDVQTKENLVLKFRALAYLYPESCKDMGLKLKQEPIGSFAFEVINEALANAGISAATDALADVIASRKLEEEVVLELLPALAMTSTPTNDAFIVAKELAFDLKNTPDIRSTAQLALGGIAYHYKKINANKSEEITRFLLKGMKSESDTLQKLYVLGNTGSPAVLPVLKGYLKGTTVSQDVRISTITAFRLIESRETTVLLHEMIKDKDSLVVKAAKDVIAFKKEYAQDL